MAVQRDTYILETEVKGVSGLEGSVLSLQRRLDALQASFSSALKAPESAKIGQRDLERITALVQELQKVQEQVVRNKSALSSGAVSLDFSKSLGQLTNLRAALSDLKKDLSSRGVDREFLRQFQGDLTFTATQLDRFRNKVSKQIGTEGQAKQQLGDASNAVATSNITQLERMRDAAQLARKAIESVGLDKLFTSAKDANQTFSALTKTMLEFNGSIEKMGELGNRAAAAIKGQRDDSTAIASNAKAREDAAKRIAAAEDGMAKQAAARQAAQVQEFQRTRAEQAKEEESRKRSITNVSRLGQATEEARRALGRLDFTKLGFEGAEQSLKRVTELFSRFNYTTAQQKEVAREVVAAVEAEAKAQNDLSAAMNKTMEVQSRLALLARRRIANTSSLMDDPAGATAVTERVQKRIDSGEIRSTVSLNRALTAEIANQAKYAKSIQLDNRVYLEQLLRERGEQAAITQAIGQSAQGIAAKKKLGGDLRSVLADTAQEATKLGLSLEKDSRLINQIFDSNVRLKEQQKAFAPKSLNEFGIAFAAGFAAQNIQQVLGGAINQMTAFEDELIKVRRTANASRDTMKALGDEILDISSRVPVAAKDLASAAAALGQVGAINFDPGKNFGRGSAEIRDAAQAIELVAQVAQVSELDINNAATAYGQFALVFSKDVNRIKEQLAAQGVQAVQTSDALRVLFGAVNEVGNQTAATTSEILDFTRQFAGVASSLGITAEKVIALGGAFRDFQVSADVAGTAMTRFFSRASQDADQFGKVLGITGEAFRARFSADALGTIIDVFKELNVQAKTNKLAITDFLRSLKVETREQNAVTKLIEGIGGLESRLRNATDTQKNYASVAEESSKRNETFSASLVKLGNSFLSLLEKARPLLDLFGKLISYIADLVKAFSNTGLAGGAVALTAIGAAAAFVVLQAVKLVFQFKLAATALRDIADGFRQGKVAADSFAASATKAAVAVSSARPGSLVPGGGFRRVGATPAAAAPKPGGVGLGGVAAGVGALGLAASFIPSASSEGEQVGKAFGDGVEKGIEDSKPEVSRSIGELLLDYGPSVAIGVAALLSALGPLKAAILGIGTAFKFVFGGIATAAATPVAAVVALSAAVAGLSLWLGTLAGKWLNIGGVADIEAQAKATERLEERLKAAAEVVASSAMLKDLAEVTARIDSSTAATVALTQQWQSLSAQINKTGNAAQSASSIIEAMLKTDSAEKMIKLMKELREAQDSDRAEANRGSRARSAGADEAATRFISEAGIGTSGANLPELAKIAKDQLLAPLIKERDKLKTDFARLVKEGAGDKELSSVSSALGTVVGRIRTVEKGYKAVEEAYKKAEDANKGLSTLFQAQENVQSGAEVALIPLLDKARQQQQVGLNNLRDAVNKFAKTDTDELTKIAEEVAAKRTDLFDRLVRPLLDRSKDLSGTDKIFDESLIKEALKGLDAATDAAMAEATDKLIRTRVKNSIKAIKDELSSAFDDKDLDDLARKNRVAADLRARSEAIRAAKEQIDQVRAEKEALDEVAETLRMIDEIRLDAIPEGLRQSSDFTEKLRSSSEKVLNVIDKLIARAKTFGQRVGDVSKAFAAMLKAEITSTKQSALNQGFAGGQKISDLRQRDKDSDRFLRTSGTGRDLVERLSAIARNDKLSKVQQGAEAGFAVSEAERKLAQQGRLDDAAPFLDKLKEEIATKFNVDDQGKQRTPVETALLDLKTVNTEANTYLKEMTGYLKTLKEKGLEATRAEIEKNAGGTVGSVGIESRKAERDIKDRTKGIASDERAVQKTRDDEAAKEEKNAFARKAAQDALDKAMRDTFGRMRDDSKITEQQVSEIRKRFKEIVDKDLKGVLTDKQRSDISTEVDKLDVSNLRDASKKISEDINSKGTSQTGGPGDAKKTADAVNTAATNLQKNNEGVGLLLTSVGNMANKVIDMSGQLDTVKKQVDKATAAGKL